MNIEKLLEILPQDTPVSVARQILALHQQGLSDARWQRTQELTKRLESLATSGGSENWTKEHVLLHLGEVLKSIRAGNL